MPVIFRRFLLTVSLLGLLCASTAMARADVILSGPDSNDGTYSTAALAATATAADTASSAGLTGISLWGLLGGAITTSTPAGDNGKNAILHDYLIATGAGGATSVISLGEIDPAFGGTQAVADFVAYQNTGGLLSAPALIVPGAPGRDVTGLNSLQVVAVPALPSGAGGASTSLALSGLTANAGTYTKATLASAFAPSTLNVAGDTYTGVPLFTFLDPSASDIASQIVVVGATDGYEVVYALAELDPTAAFAGNPNDLLPYADTAGNFPADGVARTITPLDNKQGRWVSNIDAIALLDVPEPPAWSMLAAGLVVMALARRKQSPSVLM